MAQTQAENRVLKARVATLEKRLEAAERIGMAGLFKKSYKPTRANQSGRATVFSPKLSALTIGALSD